MAKAKFKKGTRAETTESAVEVDVSGDGVIGLGEHHFELTVQDDAGNVSDPVVMTVVVKRKKPTAVLDAVGPVEYGQNFTLSGKNSSTVPPGGTLKYIWRMVD